MLGSVMDLLTLCCQDRTRSCSAADCRADRRAFAAARQSADRGADACSAADDCGITLLRRLGHGGVRFRRDGDELPIFAGDLSQFQLEYRSAFHTARRFGIDHTAADLCTFFKNRLSVYDDRL